MKGKFHKKDFKRSKSYDEDFERLPGRVKIASKKKRKMKRRIYQELDEYYEEDFDHLNNEKSDV